MPATLRLLDAVGHDPLIVETTGVGQVEIDIASAADTTVLVMAPGWGDAVQANKAGLLEVADVLVVNKADRPGARRRPPRPRAACSTSATSAATRSAPAGGRAW